MSTAEGLVWYGGYSAVEDEAVPLNSPSPSLHYIQCRVETWKILSVVKHRQRNSPRCSILDPSLDQFIIWDQLPLFSSKFLWPSL